MMNDLEVGTRFKVVSRQAATPVFGKFYTFPLLVIRIKMWDFCQQVR